jgi:hypothetical protein
MPLCTSSASRGFPSSLIPLLSILRAFHPRLPVKKTVQKLLAEYGTVAVIVYFVIFFAVLGGFWLAIRLGWQPTSAAGSVGTFAAAYIATKLTQPLRIAVTVVVTPFIAKLYERLRGRRPNV